MCLGDCNGYRWKLPEFSVIRGYVSVWFSLRRSYAHLTYSGAIGLFANPTLHTIASLASSAVFIKVLQITVRIENASRDQTFCETLQCRSLAFTRPRVFDHLSFGSAMPSFKDWQGDLEVTLPTSSTAISTTASDVRLHHDLRLPI